MPPQWIICVIYDQEQLLPRGLKTNPLYLFLFYVHLSITLSESNTQCSLRPILRDYQHYTYGRMAEQELPLQHWVL